MEEKLRECPFCGAKARDFKKTNSFSKVIIHRRFCFFTRWSGIKEMILNNDGIKKSWDTRHEPKHETVEEWERKTGDTYPDDGPVYPADMFGGKLCYKECRSYRDAKLQGWNIIIVASHHGKPEGK